MSDPIVVHPIVKDDGIRDAAPPGDRFAKFSELVQVREAIEHLTTDFLRSVAALRDMNQYQSRIQSVEDVCASILAPQPEIVKANESLIEVQQASRREFGALEFIIADWDERWRFSFSFRWERGHIDGLDGFDLRRDTPGFKALTDALESVRINPADEKLDLGPVFAPASGIVERRIIWRAAPKV